LFLVENLLAFCAGFFVLALH
jgi:hypothetical protein